MAPVRIACTSAAKLSRISPCRVTVAIWAPFERNMRWITIGLLLVLPGCVSAGHTAQTSGSGTPAGPASMSPSPVALGLCRLPFTDFTATGFMNYPDGTFTPDPSAVAGAGQQAYDRASSRWVPVSHDLVSADGSQYAYSELIPNPASQGIGSRPLGTHVHLVDVATGKDNIVYQTPDVLSAVTVKPEGIYLTQPTFIADAPVPFYLWLLDPVTGSIHQLLGAKSVGPGTLVIANGTLWIMATDLNDSKGPGTLLRVNLSDGSQSTWFEQTTKFAQFLGLDGLDHPVVITSSSDNGDPGRTWVISAAATAQPIADQEFTMMVADSRGLWFTGNGVFLYRPGGPLEKISAKIGGWILGSCG